MAGKPKKRIDYAGWSVDIFSNDPKIDKLLDAQGWIGFGIYFYLCQMAFGSEGYYYEWCYDLCATTARKMGGGVGAGTVKETVDYCLQIGLFNKGLFDRWGVLTSRGIQKSYLLVLRSKNRRGTEIINDFWLLDKSGEEYQGVIFVTKNNQKLEVNHHSLGENEQTLEVNSHSLTQKKSKVKDSKEDKKTIERFTPPSVKEVSEYCLSRNNGIDAQSFIDFYKSKGWMIGKNKMKDWKAAIRTWESSRKEKASTQKPDNNKFNQFPQRNYDFDELERKLLQK